MNNKEIVNKFFKAVWTKEFDPSVIRELAHENGTFSYPMHGEFHGAEEYITMLEDFRESFEDLDFWAVDDFIAEGDYVVGRWEGGGTHTGKAFTKSPYGGVLPENSGTKIFFSGTTVFKLKNGKIISEIGEEGAIDALLQMKLVEKQKSYTFMKV